MIELSSVTIRIGDFQLKDLSFRVDSGQYTVVMGKTGIGKTTILEAICGLRSIQTGRILINGVDVTRWTPADRNVGYMPQDLALFPSMTVREHIEFAMKVRNRPAKEMAELLRNLFNVVVVLNRPETELGASQLAIRPGERKRVRSRMPLRASRKECL